ncbi:ABC transporter permease [Siculibacillus lacustris]|uniref:ABC transporter permease n=1 Tax=Siculibacillus lacustris TaxID=1549641 RepID=A0A4Q9VXQ4_9HYPH|nr:ABC transporter permease [Siculibacillus lacustris]TBW41286.1 ABC transporter permease [Siculibacillus lacustris]
MAEPEIFSPARPGEPAPRPDILRPAIDDLAPDVVVERGLIVRLAETTWLRRVAVVVVLGVIWEVYARQLANPLMFPSLTETLEAFVAGLRSGALVSAVSGSLRILLVGYGVAVVLSTLITALAIGTRIGTDVLSTLTSMFNPLPAIAILPLAMLWFGLGVGSVVFVIVHSVLWAVSLNTLTGFQSVSATQRMVGRNYGLKGFAFVRAILIPAAFPAILSGLKIGWAFSWRTLIAAELVFGVSGGAAGLGWYIFQNRNALETPNVFAGLLTVIVIGLLVEGVVFRAIESATIRRWGMQA